MAELRHRLDDTKVKEVLAGGMHQFIDLLQISLNDIGDAMNEDYFHSLVPNRDNLPSQRRNPTR